VTARLEQSLWRGEADGPGLNCLLRPPQGILTRPEQNQEARMGEGPPKPASAPTGAVFLSYASQDQEAARETCRPRHAKKSLAQGWGRPCTVIQK
jgi:hypothetical protein